MLLVCESGCVYVRERKSIKRGGVVGERCEMDEIEMISRRETEKSRPVERKSYDCNTYIPSLSPVNQ